MKDPRRERHHRQRVIHNRLRFIRDAYGGSYGLGNRGPGGLSKDHLTNCSCPGCANGRMMVQTRKHAPRRQKARTCQPKQWADYEAVAEGMPWIGLAAI